MPRGRNAVISASTVAALAAITLPAAAPRTESTSADSKEPRVVQDPASQRSAQIVVVAGLPL
jgi:hypothetical protein